jgi:hypothetical protein
MAELFDWYQAQGQVKGPGFLVDSIRNYEEYRFPQGFEPSVQRQMRERAINSRKRASQELFLQKEEVDRQKLNERLEPFTAFWQGLTESARLDFENEAIAAADSMKRQGYFRNQKAGGDLFEQYRRLILLNHFERQQNVLTV